MMNTASSELDPIVQVITSDKSDFGAPSLHIGNPFAVLI
jgi:hypothetical protein